MWHTEAENTSRIENGERNLGTLWFPLLPEQEASIRKRPDILSYFVAHGRGITADMLALQPESVSAHTIRNAKGLGARIVGADNPDQAVIKLVHAGIIPLAAFETPEDPELFRRIEILTQQPNGTGRKNAFLLQAAAAGATTEQVANALGITTHSVFKEYALCAERLGMPDMLTAGLAYLRFAGLQSVKRYLPEVIKETEQSYKFSHTISPENLPAIYMRQKPVYEFLERFDQKRLQMLCQNLAKAEKDALETYAKVGNKQNVENKSVDTLDTQLRAAQAVLGTQTFEQAAVLYLAYKRGLPSPEQFGLTRQRMIIIWYYAKGYDINQIGELMHKDPDSVIHRTLTQINEALGVKFGQDSAERSVMRLIELGFPVSEILGDLTHEQLVEYLVNLTDFQREALDVVTDPFRPAMTDLPGGWGIWTSRVARATKRLHLNRMQVLALYKGAKQLNLLEQVKPSPSGFAPPQNP